MRKVYLYLFLFCVLISCQKLPDIQLPKVSKAELTKLTNHSQAYIFYDLQASDSVLLNRKNLILNTHWVVHADARLSLKKLLPKLEILRKKRERKSIHTKEEMNTYFSVMDESKKQLGFIDYSSINYKFPDTHAKFYIKELPAVHMDLYTLIINYDQDNKITVDGNLIAKEELSSFLKEQIDFASEGRKTLLYLNFDEQLSFDQYLKNYVMISQLANENIRIAKEQFIYNYDKLPDCNCSL
ncbi:hypothetical protein ACJD0Z_14570 [Flavobacteriaceae bacterium M23B6Z8]